MKLKKAMHYYFIERLFLSVWIKLVKAVNKFQVSVHDFYLADNFYKISRHCETVIAVGIWFNIIIFLMPNSKNKFIR